MPVNSSLNEAKENKKDEFYTQLSDIELELKNYKNDFDGKVVLCNCDDPYESNFFKYFAVNFNYLHLKKLIATCYDGSPIAGEQLSIFDFANDSNVSKEETKRIAHKIEINEVEDFNGDGAIDLFDIETLLKNKRNVLTKLDGNGDFQSLECIELLKESDVVVTNPPFSLFREYVLQLMKYNKKFIILGNVNAITYKEIFPLIKDNKLWLGQSIHSGDRAFRVPDDYPLAASNFHIDENGYKYIRVKGVRWYTNLENKNHNKLITLYKNYSAEAYPKYDNYDAINVDKVSDIPCDYEGIMGVPITFIDRFNPSQFEIVGCTEAGNNLCIKFYEDMYQHAEGKKTRNMKSARYAPMIRHDVEPAENYYTVSNGSGYLTKCYFRIFIRRKHNEN